MYPRIVFLTPPALLPTSRLPADDLAWVRRFLAPRPWFDFYLQTALDDLAGGLDNRVWLLGEARRGLALSLRLDDIDLVSFVGDLADDELAFTAHLPHRAELHAEPPHVRPLLAACEGRIRRTDLLRYYTLADPPPPAPEPCCRRVASADHSAVLGFFEAHYPETVLDPWMLDALPFVGVWDGDDLVATAGTITVHRGLGACHLGHFLTRPDRRGEGLAKVAARGLMAELMREGITTFHLGVYDANPAAWRAYETLGFEVVEKRPLIYLDPPT